MLCARSKWSRAPCAARTICSNIPPNTARTVPRNESRVRTTARLRSGANSSNNTCSASVRWLRCIVCTKNTAASTAAIARSSALICASHVATSPSKSFWKSISNSTTNSSRRCANNTNSSSNCSGEWHADYFQWKSFVMTFPYLAWWCSSPKRSSGSNNSSSSRVTNQRTPRITVHCRIIVASPPMRYEISRLLFWHPFDWHVSFAARGRLQLAQHFPVNSSPFIFNLWYIFAFIIYSIAIQFIFYYL